MKAWLGLAAGAVAFVGYHHAALACGACFIPPDSETVVSGHRMVMSISSEQTVLWDQIQYQGAPEEFAWVLPVKPGATIEEATDAFFETLEATTRTTVAGPPVNCSSGDDFYDYGEGGDGCSPGCGDMSAGSEDGGTGGGAAFGGPRQKNPVEVVHQGSVGPYETVTLSTDTPGALNVWLGQHGYNVDAAAQPIIDDYVAEGFDFIALRLQPGQGVQQMKPVKIVMPGASLSLPLRMVAIGTGPQTPIVLYLIGEGRYQPMNLQEAAIDMASLSFDFADSTSNYEALRRQALGANGGKSFVTTFAKRDVFTSLRFPFGTAGGTQSFQAIYSQQAISNGEATGSCALQPVAGGVVANPCPPGEPFDSPQCTSVEPNQIDARELGCDGAYDISTALIGMRPADVWVTRIEGIWPREALAEDLDIGAGAQGPVENALAATKSTNDDQACSGTMGGTFAIWKKLDPPKKTPKAPFFYLLGGLALISRRLLRAARPTRIAHFS